MNNYEILILKIFRHYFEWKNHFDIKFPHGISFILLSPKNELGNGFVYLSGNLYVECICNLIFFYI